MQPISLQSEIFTRGVENIITKDELQKLLKQRRPWRIKHGIDATAPDLHIGHAASLWKLRALQEAGHKAVVLLGDVTTQIGDPTGRAQARPLLSPKEIAKNTAAIEKQVRKILLTTPARFELRRSSEWYKKTSVPDFLKLLSLVTHARLIERDMFQKRIKEGREIFESEIVYPVLQGYDSVMLKSDLTVIGSDQLFNEHLGRALQEKFGQKPQVIVALKILPGLDGGAKMSKSLGNYIGLGDSPRDKFGKAMRLLDSLLVPYFEAYTQVPKEKVREVEKTLQEGGNPMEAKLFFAQSLVGRYHGREKAQKEREYFLQVFSQKKFSGIPSVSVVYGRYPVADLLLRLGLVASKSQARRLIAQQAVEVGGQRVRPFVKEVEISKGTVIRVGKRKFVRVR